MKQSSHKVIFLLTGLCLTGLGWHPRGALAVARRDIDKIVPVRGRPLDGIEVVKETYKDVHFRVYIDNQAQPPQARDRSQVKEVVYGDVPRGYMLAESLMQQRRYGEAIKRFEESKGGRVRAWVREYSDFNIAECYRMQPKPKHDDAIKSYAAILQGNKESKFAPLASLSIGRCLLGKGSIDEALARFQALANTEQYGPVSQFRARLWQGRAYEVKKNATAYGEAQQVYEKLAADVQRVLQDSSDEDELSGIVSAANLGRGKCMMGQQNYSEAVVWFTKLTSETKPDQEEVLAGAYNALGDCHAKIRGKDSYRKALLSYLRVVVLYSSQEAEVSRATFLAGECFRLLAQMMKRDDPMRARYDKFARELYEETYRKYLESPWAAKAKERGAGPTEKGRTGK